MHDKLNQFTRNDRWYLVPKVDCMNVIGTNWVLRNKLDEASVITRNKVRLVAKGYNQEEGIDYDETFAPVAKLEVVRRLLAFAFMSGFKLFQMDVKSAFLNGFIDEKFYVSQPPGFEDLQYPNHVYDGRVVLLLRVAGHTIIGWHLSKRNQVLQGDSQEV